MSHGGSVYVIEIPAQREAVIGNGLLPVWKFRLGSEAEAWDIFIGIIV